MRAPSGSILVVDDDERVRDAVRVLLEGEGFAVATAADGAEAIGRLEAGDVSLVLLDLAMPGVDGWQFLARREKEIGFPRAPVVLLSGLPFIPDAPGVADFLRKPIDSRKLIDCVHRFCGKPGPLSYDSLVRYSIEEYVRWEDIDAAGIINYQAYLRFFGLAEAELLRSAGLTYKYLFETLDIWLPRVRVECDFHEPVKLDELLIVEAYFSRIGRTSIHLNFEVRRKADPARPVASGKYVLVCVRQGDFDPVPVPREIRERIAPFVEGSGGGAST